MPVNKTMEVVPVDSSFKENKVTLESNQGKDDVLPKTKKSAEVKETMEGIRRQCVIDAESLHTLQTNDELQVMIPPMAIESGVYTGRTFYLIPLLNRFHQTFYTKSS